MFDLTSEGWSAVLTMGKIFSSSGRSKTSTIIGQSRVCVSTFEIVSIRFHKRSGSPRAEVFLALSLSLSLSRSSKPRWQTDVSSCSPLSSVTVIFYGSLIFFHRFLASDADLVTGSRLYRRLLVCRSGTQRFSRGAGHDQRTHDRRRCGGR